MAKRLGLRNEDITIDVPTKSGIVAVVLCGYLSLLRMAFDAQSNKKEKRTGFAVFAEGINSTLRVKAHAEGIPFGQGGDSDPKRSDSEVAAKLYALRKAHEKNKGKVDGWEPFPELSGIPATAKKEKKTYAKLSQVTSAAANLDALNKLELA